MLLLNSALVMLQVKPFDYEHSEMLLYQNMVLREAGMTEDALKHLDVYDSQLVDRMTVKEIKGKATGCMCSGKRGNRIIITFIYKALYIWNTVLS